MSGREMGQGWKDAFLGDFTATTMVLLGYWAIVFIPRTLTDGVFI